MDYSKFTTEDLLALRAQDYGKVSTEGLIMYRDMQGVEQSVGPAPVQAEPVEEEELTNLGAAKKGIAAGVLDLSKAAATATRYLGGRLGSETLQDIGKMSAEYIQPTAEKYEAPSQIQGDIVDKPELLKDPKWWTYNIGRMGTSMAPAIALGAVSPGAGAALGGAIGGLQEGSGTYEEILSRGGTEQQAARGMEAMTVGAGLLNAFSLGKMLKPGKLGLVKRILTSAVTEAGTEYTEEPLEILIKKGLLTEDMFSDKEAWQQLRSGANVLPVSAVLGAIGGTVGGTMQQKTVVEDKPPAPDPSLSQEAPAVKLKEKADIAARRRLAQVPADIDMQSALVRQTVEQQALMEETKVEGQEVIVEDEAVVEEAPVEVAAEPAPVAVAEPEVNRSLNERTVTEPVQATEVVEEAPLTYDELNALSRKGYPVLADVPVQRSAAELEQMTPEQLEAEQLSRPQTKLAESKTPAEWRAILNETASMQTAEQMAAGRLVAEKVKQSMLAQRQFKALSEILEKAGFTEAEILEMEKAGTLEQRAAEVSGEQPSMALSKSKQPVLDDLEQMFRNIADMHQRGEAVPEDVLDMALAKAEETGVTEILEPFLYETKYSIFEKIDPTTGSSISVAEYKNRLDRIKKAVAKVYEPESVAMSRRKSARARHLLGKVGQKQATDYEALLREEGMGEEIGTEKELSPEEYEAKHQSELAEDEQYGAYDWADRSLNFTTIEELNAMLHRRSRAARKFVLNKLKQETLTNEEARQLRISAYRYLPETQNDAEHWAGVVREAELRSAQYIQPIRRAFSLKAIARAVADGRIDKKHAEYMRAIISTLRETPDFQLEFGTRQAVIGGTYDFVENLLQIQAPKDMAHEVSHYGFHNALSASDRLKYYKSFVGQFYQDGVINRQKMQDATTNELNAYNPSEVFASRMSDYANTQVLTKTERSLFEKILHFFRQVMQKVKAKNVVFTDVQSLFDKVLSKDSRLDLETEVDGQSIVSQPSSAAEYSIDFSGLSTAIKRLNFLSNLTRKASKTTEGAEIVDHIQKDGDGRPWEQDKIILQEKADPGVRETLYRHLGNLLRSPLPLVKGTILEPLVYKLNLGELFYSHMFNQHQHHLNELVGTLGKESQIKVTSYLREVQDGKLPTAQLTQQELELANGLRDWLDIMKSKHKLHMLNEYKKHLTKTEYNILMDIIAGVPLPEVQLKHKRTSTETVEEIAEEYKKIDTWGIDNYIPNVEMGKYKVMAMGMDKNDKPYKYLVAVGMSKKDAVRKAIRVFEEGKHSTLFIDTSFLSDQEYKQSLSRKQYFAMQNKMVKELQANIDSINKEIAKRVVSKGMKGQFAIKPTEVFAEFTKPRRDQLLGEDNVIPVLYRYAMSMEKKWALDPIIDDIRKNLGKMTPNEMAFIIDYAQDVKGKYTKMDKVFDEVMASINNRLGLELPESRTWSRGLAKIRSAEAVLKLGYRPVAAGINLAAGLGHTYVKVGLPYMKKAYDFLKTPEGKSFLEAVEPYLGVSIVDIDTQLKTKMPMYHPLKMFQAPEPYNRSMSVAANYIWALEKEGLTPTEAKHFAIRANMAQQFTYNMASLPKIMRGPGRKTIMQFKPYLFKELEFMSSLTGKEWLRYAGMQLALGGPRGYVMILRSLPFLTMFGFLEEAFDEVEKWMNKELPIASRGIAALPSLIRPDMGVDITAPATFQFPNEVMDYLGPTISDLHRIYKDVIVPLTTYGPSEIELRNASKIAAVASHWRRLLDFVIDNDGWVRDEKRNKLYEVPDNYTFFLQSIMGAEPIEMNRTRIAQQIATKADDRHSTMRTRLMRAFIADIVRGNEIEPEFMARLIKHGVTAQGLISSLKSHELTPEHRALLRTELMRRPELLEYFPSTAQDYGHSQIQP